MIRYPDIVSAVIPVFVIILIGFVLRRIRVLTGEADKSLMKLTVNVLYPMLVLSNTIGNPALLRLSSVFIPAVTGLCFVLFAMAAAYFLAPLFGLREDVTRRTFAVATGIQNYGFLAIPVLAAVFGAKNGTLGILFAHSLGVEIALWTAGITLMTGVYTAPWRKLMNGPLVAIVIGLAINFAGAGVYIPKAASSVIATLGSCAIPLSLLLIGASIFDLTRDNKWRGTWQSSFCACLVRLLIAPAALLTAIAFLPFPALLKQVLIVQAAMPAALFPIILSRHYGGNPSTAVQVAIVTTAVSFFTIPLVILLGIRLAGLE